MLCFLCFIECTIRKGSAGKTFRCHLACYNEEFRDSYEEADAHKYGGNFKEKLNETVLLEMDTNQVTASIWKD